MRRIVLPGQEYGNSKGVCDAAPSVPVPACVTTDLNSNSGLAVALAWLVPAWVSGCVVAVGG